jgi:SAM-dependent methyltransferase
MTQAAYDPEFFAKLWQVEDRHFWFRTRNRVISSAVQRLISELPAGYRVLEVGCGTGNVLRHLESVCRDGQVIGLDAYLEGLRFARRRVRCPLIQADIHHPPFKTPFDLIGIFDVLEHLPDDQSILRTLHRLLTPEGRLIITVPAHMSLWSYFDNAAQHYRRYSQHTLRQALQASGFDVIFLTHYMAAIFPLVWLGRRLAARRSADQSALAADELKIVPLLNRLLMAILALEAPLIAAYARLPFGTSLLAIARKKRQD